MARMLPAVLVLVSLVTTCWSADGKSLHHRDVGVALEIAARETQWAAAQKVGDAKAVEPLLAAGFVNTDADGQTYGKERLLSNLKGGEWESNAISDVKVLVYGNTAIATGAWTGKGVDGDGTKIDRRERWTDTWVKMPNGKWQCVASQQTGVVARP